jgi:hypothetical protein
MLFVVFIQKSGNTIIEGYELGGESQLAVRSPVVRRLSLRGNKWPQGRKAAEGKAFLISWLWGK